MASGGTIKFTTSDGVAFDVDLNIAKLSKTIESMEEVLNGGDDSAEESNKNPDDAILLPLVRSDIFKKVLEWLEHHKDDPPRSDEDEDDKRRGECTLGPWDTEYFKIDQCTLFEIILAANYLDIRALLDTACKAVASLMNGKSPEELRKMFNVTNDLTPEETEQIRKENEWCEEK